MKTDNLTYEFYAPSGTYELFDPESDQYFNSVGQTLRNPVEYDNNSEGYTPFGDE